MCRPKILMQKQIFRWWNWWQTAHVVSNHSLPGKPLPAPPSSKKRRSGTERSLCGILYAYTQGKCPIGKWWCSRDQETADYDGKCVRTDVRIKKSLQGLLRQFGTDLTIHSQQNDHSKEADGPDLRPGQKGHHLWVDYKHKSRTCSMEAIHLCLQRWR